jgi:hypothetical protein
MRTRIFRFARGGASIALLATGLGAVGALGVGLATSGVASAAGPVHSGVYNCTIGLPGKITLAGAVNTAGTAPATLHIASTFTDQPHIKFTVTGTLLALAGVNTLFTITINGSKVGMVYSGFTGVATDTQTGSATVHLPAPFNTQNYWRYTGATAITHPTPTHPTKGAPRPTTTPTYRKTGVPPAQSATLLFAKTPITMTAATGVTATVDTLDLSTTILVAVKCHPTNFAHPVSFGHITTIKSSGFAPLVFTTPAGALPAGQATRLYTHGATYWTSSGGHGGNVWSETGTLDGLIFAGSGNHASLTGTPTAAATLSFTVTVRTGTSITTLTHHYTLSIAAAPATPTTIQPFKLTVTPGTLTLTCATAKGPTKPNVDQDVTSQATAKPCTLITLGNIKLNEKRHIVTTTGHNLIISTARGGAHDSWALYAVMIPTSTLLTGNPVCNFVQGFCNKTTTTPTTFPSHIINTTITPNYLGVKSKCETNHTNPLTTYYNDNPTPTATAGVTPGAVGLSIQTKLCSAATGFSGGQFFVTTLDYTLIVPPNVYAGTYYGTVLYTLSSTAANVPANPVTPPQ